MKWILIAMQAFVIMFCFVNGTNAKAEGPVPEVTEKEPEVTILLERMYVDGEVSEEIFTEKVADLEKFLQQYKEWQLVDRDDVQIVLQKKVDDISPLLKRAVILECQRKEYYKFLKVYRKVIMRFIPSFKLI